MAHQVDIEDLLNGLAPKPLDDEGREIPDPVPVAPPIGYVRQPSMVEHIRSMVRSETLRLHVEAQGFETFEEADDFDVGDDLDPASPYEEVFEPPAPPPVLAPAPAAAEGVAGGGHPKRPPLRPRRLLRSLLLPVDGVPRISAYPLICTVVGDT